VRGMLRGGTGAAAALRLTPKHEGAEEQCAKDPGASHVRHRPRVKLARHADWTPSAVTRFHPGWATRGERRRTATKLPSGRIGEFCRLVLESLAVSRVLVDTQACHDRRQVLVEEELEVVRRVIDVNRTEPDLSFAVLVKRVERSREPQRWNADLLNMLRTSLVDDGEPRGRLCVAAHPEPGTGDYGLPARAERLIPAAEQSDEKITVHKLNLPSRLGGHKPVRATHRGHPRSPRTRT
jgi:hypothetical protein